MTVERPMTHESRLQPERAFEGTASLIVIVAALALQGCTAHGAGVARGPFTADLATHHQLASSPNTVAITEPLVRIGGSSAPGDSAMGFVYGVLLDRRNRLWVSDRYAASIARFDERGRFIDHVGRKGQGPGEFAWVQLVGWMDDSAAAWDGDLRRITLIPEAGGDPVSGPSGFGPRIVFGVGTLRTQVYTDPTRTGHAPRLQGAWYTPPVSLDVASQRRSADSPAVVVRLRPSDLYLDKAGSTLDPFRYSRPPVVYHDTVAVVGSPAADLLLVGLYGEEPVAFDLDSVPGTPFTPELRARFQRRYRTEPRPGFASIAVLAARGWPDRIPAFDHVVVSRNGVLWLHHWEDTWSTDTARWEVVTIEGKHLGTATLPAGETIVAANGQRIVTLSHDKNEAAVLTEYEQPFGRQ